ncbi:MAG: hypothetical protein O3C63_04105 [Cyanobacteria bacterium]|nr:hypothetical protein [Cyanobacteriota bacterium]MDA1021415.1 hypothetical protein [Cyanobacteriota bacterium]
MLQNLSEIQKLRATIKTNDGWWTSVLVAPCANRLVQLIADFQFIKPNHLCYFSYSLGILAVYFFAKGEYMDLLIAAISVQASFVFAIMSEQLARYRQDFSGLEFWLNQVSDRLKLFLYIFALAWGFFNEHVTEFYISFAPLNQLINLFFDADTLFMMPMNLQLVLMLAKPVPSWFICPLAILAFLFIDFVNQKLELPVATIKKNHMRMPISRFNIGEQGLLISLLAAFDMVLTLFVLLSLFGAWNSLIYLTRRGLFNDSLNPK